jgi:hypothetical protein
LFEDDTALPKKALLATIPPLKPEVVAEILMKLFACPLGARKKMYTAPAFDKPVSSTVEKRQGGVGESAIGQI